MSPAMEFLKSIGGKIVAGTVALIVIVAAISWWQMDADSRNQVMAAAGKVVAWAFLVIVAPWVLFWVIAWVKRFERNSAGAALVILLTLAEAIVLGWLLDWQWGGGAASKVLTIAGIMLAGVYNVLACDWIAEKLD